MFKLVGKNCKDIKSIEIVIEDSKKETFQQSFLKDIRKIFPDVLLTMACVDGKIIYRVTDNMPQIDEQY